MTLQREWEAAIAQRDERVFPFGTDLLCEEYWDHHEYWRDALDDMRCNDWDWFYEEQRELDGFDDTDWYYHHPIEDDPFLPGEKTPCLTPWGY